MISVWLNLKKVYLMQSSLSYLMQSSLSYLTCRTSAHIKAPPRTCIFPHITPIPRLILAGLVHIQQSNYEHTAGPRDRFNDGPPHAVMCTRMDLRTTSCTSFTRSLVNCRRVSSLGNHRVIRLVPIAAVTISSATASGVRPEPSAEPPAEVDGLKDSKSSGRSTCDTGAEACGEAFGWPI